MLLAVLALLDVLDLRAACAWARWGGNLAAAAELPVRLRLPGRVVYSPHDYPPSVYRQAWFTGDHESYASTLPLVWDRYWGHLLGTGDVAGGVPGGREDIGSDAAGGGDPAGEAAAGVPVLLGEFGSFCSTAEDTAWLCALCGYGAEKRLSFAFWCLNPNSADTGGLLLDDWTTPHAPKLRLLAPLLAEASASTSHSASEPPE